MKASQDAQIWRIKSPEYHSAKIAFANNGSIEFPFGLPGVRCCGTWAGCDVINVNLPPALQNIAGYTDRRPVSPQLLESLKEVLYKFAEFEDTDIARLVPGTRFLPPVFIPPKHDDNDFLWSLSEAPVVSLRIAALLQRQCPKDYIGVAIPGYPDWVLLVIKNRSLPPIERRSSETCSICGRPTLISAPSKLEIFKDMIPMGNLFVLDTTLHLLITDRLKRLLVGAGAKNIDFVKVSIGDAANRTANRDPQT